MTEENQDTVRYYIKTFADLGFLVFADAYSHYVNFRIYDGFMAVDGTHSTQMQATEADATEGSIISYSAVEAQVAEKLTLAIDGTIKYDGVGNWRFPDAANGAFLTCGKRYKQGVYRLSAIMEKCWDAMDDICMAWGPVDDEPEEETPAVASTSSVMIEDVPYDHTKDVITKIDDKTYTRYFADLWYTVKADIKEHYAELKIYAVTGWDDNGPMYQKAGSNSSGVASENGLEDAEVFINFDIKWDGCANWILANDNIWAHVCGVDELTKFGKLLPAMYNWAGPLIPRWDL